MNADAGDETGEPKTPASKKRKRTVAAKREDEDGTPVKKERAVKKETNVKKEESDDSDVKVKGEEDGSSVDTINTATAATALLPPSSPPLSCYVGGVGTRGELPGKMPQPQDLANRRHNEAADDEDDSDCVVICERPVALLPSPATISCQSTAPQISGYGTDHRPLPSPPNFGYDHHLYHHRRYHCHHPSVSHHYANPDFPLQTNTPPSDSILQPELAMHNLHRTFWELEQLTHFPAALGAMPLEAHSVR